MLLRSITGVLLLSVIIGSIICSQYTYAICVSSLISLSLWEFYSIVKTTGYKPLTAPGITIGLCFFFLSFLHASQVISGKYFIIFIPMLAYLFIAELYRKHEKPFQNIAITILGLAYISVPFSLFNHIAFHRFNNYEYSYGLILSLFAFNWVNDTGAYLAGVSMGRNKLFERISPKKSWEGAIGGALSVVAISFLFAHLMPYISTVHWIFLGLVVCVFGIYGDLIESLMKRSAGVKDSGSLLPGHGGFLDRFDAVIFTIPPFFGYIMLLQ